MRKPLSYLEYYRGNKKKTLSLIISIAFSVFLIGSIQMFLNNIITTGGQTVLQYERFTIIESREEPLDENFIQKLRSNPSIARVIPAQKLVVLFRGLGTNSGADCYIMDRENIRFLAQMLQIDIDDADIPKNNEKSLVLNKNLIKNNKFEIGDEIKDSGGIKLSGEFEGEYLTGFVAGDMEGYLNGLIVVPVEGKLEEMNSFIRAEISDSSSLTDLETINKMMDNVVGDVKQLFNIVTVIVLFTIGIGLGISTYVHYFQRRKEFGVMSSIGYTHRSILIRINKEILITAFVAFAVGLLMLLIEAILMNKLLLQHEGTALFKLSTDIIARASIIPLFTSAFSLIPTWVLLKKIDSISIIEGVN
jgi:ABC-type antimicrobial peptide transport system permease subunit